ncbi:non-muscle caldesmon isoform X2 [Xiphias gladius]|uniref:non-muscle caldesmon isoform X2 n=1 Tax=Xiphias gladius TaxID=8245 RepID=UPI001A99A324|nr:non-muscle caldesmon isoform X2 [Xiphias gladius]
MSNGLLRRNSSKQGLQNLMRLTAQRSIEDAEEVERERRRRAREALRRRNSGSTPGESSPENEMPTEENLYDSDLKPSSYPSLEEDEGFSDWTQRREKRRQQRLQELSQGGEEDEDEEEDPINKAVSVKTAKASITSSGRLQRREQEEIDRARMEVERRKEREEEAIRAERVRREKEREEDEKRKTEEVVTRRREEIQRPKTEVEKRKEVKVSYTSKVFLHQEPKNSNANGDATVDEVTSYINNKAKRSTSRATEPEEAEAILETEQRLEKIRRGLQMKESQELEQLRHRQSEAEQELEELKRRREERRRVREEEERRREEEEQQRLAKEEEERRRMKGDIERRRMEAAERMKSLSTSGVDGDEMFSPFSPKAPTHKITERTECLNRSLKKSFKKTQPLVLLSKIDDKLEQYAHAVENSQEARAVKASLADLPSSPEVVSSKKNLFEAGEAWSQSPAKAATCKDADGLKVGVASLITQWVKGPSDGSRQSPCKPTDVRPGDVMQKKNMWEIIGDSSGRPGQRAQGSAAGKKYKFVVTGHGKYEKIPVDDENGGDFTNDLCHGDY